MTLLALSVASWRNVLETRHGYRLGSRLGHPTRRRINHRIGRDYIGIDLGLLVGNIDEVRNSHYIGTLRLGGGRMRGR